MIITNISEIYGTGLRNAWLRVDSDRGRFVSCGEMHEFPQPFDGEELVDACGGFVLPSFCDSHTHIVYAGTRDGEFLDKINGLSYEEIAARGGGILNSADLLHETSEADLFMQSMDRVNEVMMSGTGCLEIKSGYGLRLEDELKMLRVIALISEASPMHVRATFLGAHAVGRAYVGRQDDYVQHIISDMLPAVAAEGLADFVDVFCDEGFFTPEQTDRILTAAAHFGLRPKIHANELAVSGGVEVGLAHKALSVDHLERAEDAQIALLAKSDTIATMLPGASFFLGMPYAPARKAVDAGCTVALASDYNPGSSPSGDMRFIWSLGCIKMRLTPEEALDAITINGAGAMGDPINYGSVAPGKVANFIITLPVPSLAYIPYAHHTPFIQAIYLNGKKIR